MAYARPPDPPQAHTATTSCPESERGTWWVGRPIEYSSFHERKTVRHRQPEQVLVSRRRLFESAPHPGSLVLTRDDGLRAILFQLARQSHPAYSSRTDTRQLPNSIRTTHQNRNSDQPTKRRSRSPHEEKTGEKDEKTTVHRQRITGHGRTACGVRNQVSLL